MTSISRLIRRLILKPAPYVAAMLLVPLLAGAAGLGIRVATPAHASTPPAYSDMLPPLPSPDPSKKTAVVLSSAYGAEMTDFLPTFEILSRSGALNVYAVAPDRAVVPLVNSNMEATSLDFVPHFSFADYDAQIGAPPDVIAVPWFPNYTPERDAAVIDWIRAHAGRNTILLTICAGSEILADTGLMNGHIATTNTGWFDKLEPRFPRVTWVRNVRYYDDGAIITSSNLAAGIDATLHTVDRLAGREVALRVARELGYGHTGYLDNPAFQPPSMTSLVAAVLNAAFQIGRQDVGVLLYDGVSEMGLAAMIDPTTSSFTTTTHVMAAERLPVWSRNGLAFIPRTDLSAASRVSRILLPAGDATTDREATVAAVTARVPGRSVERIHARVGNGESAYDATLDDIARVQNGATARSIARGMFYAGDEVRTADARPPILPAFSAGTLALLGLGIAMAASRFAPRGTALGPSRS